MTDFNDINGLRSLLNVAIAAVYANPTVDAYYNGYNHAITLGAEFNELSKEAKASDNAAVCRWLVTKYADSLAASSALLLSQSDFVALQSRIFAELVGSNEHESTKQLAISATLSNPYFSSADVETIVGKDAVANHAKYIVEQLLGSSMPSKKGPELVIDNPDNFPLN